MNRDMRFTGFSDSEAIQRGANFAVFIDIKDVS